MSLNELPSCPTGITGLDIILRGGLTRNCLYLIEGNPGVGKTTLALQFLMEGVRRNERCLYVTLSETKTELAAVARSHDWNLDGINIIELSAIEAALAGKAQNTLFQSSELELNQLSKLLLDEVDRIKPSRIVLDSLSEMRLLAQNPLRYRRQVLALKQRFAERESTVLLLDDRSATGTDIQVQSIVHGTISLSSVEVKYGGLRRYLSVTKLRGVRFQEGNHDYLIKKGGLRVFPRLIAADHHVEFKDVMISSGNEQLDTLVGGGLHAGTSNLLIGPAGTGKSTISAMFAHAAAGRGQRVNYYTFDESVHILRNRARELSLNMDGLIDKGLIELRQLDPAQVSPGELAYDIRQAVEREHTKVVVLDSLNGYVSAVPSEEYLYLHLHELVTYLNQQGVMTLMVMAQHGLVGPMGVPIDISYLADTVILTRYFEALGGIKKAISVIKKRSGRHETTIRELSMTPNGVLIGPPLVDFEGVLTGVPRFFGTRDKIQGHETN
ncbi:MAG TPA: ATPase domain-containing protein [Gammaproteobacteria bacterium]|nr:ATPase domain-containing protein [Gammaproteobacteria bacterium]